jgi:hypothetical protein
MRAWLRSLIPIVIVASMFALAFSALGMELFGRYLFRFVQDSAYGTARGSFNLFIPGELGYGAILTMFQITSAPNWHEVMHMTIHGSGNHWASVFFMVTVILGIMLVHLSAATIYSCMQDLSDAFQQKEDAKKAAGSKADAPLASQTGIGGEDAFDTSIRLANAENQSHSSTQTALFIRPNTPIRLLVQKFVNSPYFTILRMALVAAQMCMLAAEYPIQGPCSETKYLSRQCVFRNPVELYPRLDDALIILHAIEVSIQVLDRGLIMHEGAYLRSMGNVLDLFILFISVVAKSVLHCATANRACEFFLWFRPLRVLRVMHFVHFLRKVLSRIQAIGPFCFPFLRGAFRRPPRIYVNSPLHSCRRSSYHPCSWQSRLCWARWCGPSSHLLYWCALSCASAFLVSFSSRVASACAASLQRSLQPQLCALGLHHKASAV